MESTLDIHCNSLNGIFQLDIILLVPNELFQEKEMLTTVTSWTTVLQFCSI